MLISSTKLSRKISPFETPGQSILFVGGEIGVTRREFLSSHNFNVMTTESVVNAVRLCRDEPFDFVLLDEGLLENDLSPAHRLRAQTETSGISLFICAAAQNEKVRHAALELGADDFLDLEIDEKELLWRLNFQRSATQRARRLQTECRQAVFLAELGKRLLVTLDPEQVISHLAGTIYETTDAVLCAAAADVSGNSPTVAAFNREGAAEGANEIHPNRLKKWLRGECGQDSFFCADESDFLLSDEFHGCEFIAPLLVGERIKGVIVVAFDRAADCTPEIQNLIEAAADFAAPSVHVTSLYDAALNASIYLVKEEQKRFTDSVLDALPLSLYAVDREYRIVAWNRHREEGKQGIPRQAVIGRNVFDVLIRQPRETLEREFERAFATGQIERVEQKTVDERGTTKHWLVSKIPMRDEGGEVTHVISVGEDVTTRVEASHAIVRAEKLAAIGRLASGIVHEINNPLATIAACAEALETRTGEGAFGSSADIEDLHEYLTLIRSEAFRCKTITNGLLDFSRARSSHRTAVNIGEVARSSANLVAHQKRGENIEIVVKADDNLPSVSADEGQLQQAFIALATNAIDAMPDGGKLTFRVFKRRRRIYIEIEDTGVGIQSENMTKIFEPFFTTKEVGHGTGLGLAVCYGIVTEHDGSLNVRSTVGIGTTFTISLPISNDFAER